MGLKPFSEDTRDPVVSQFVTLVSFRVFKEGQWQNVQLEAILSMLDRIERRLVVKTVQ